MFADFETTLDYVIRNWRNEVGWYKWEDMFKDEFSQNDKLHILNKLETDGLIIGSPNGISLNAKGHDIKRNIETKGYVAQKRKADPSEMEPLDKQTQIKYNWFSNWHTWQILSLIASIGTFGYFLGTQKIEYDKVQLQSKLDKSNTINDSIRNLLKMGKVNIVYKDTCIKKTELVKYNTLKGDQQNNTHGDNFNNGGINNGFIGKTTAPVIINQSEIHLDKKDTFLLALIHGIMKAYKLNKVNVGIELDMASNGGMYAQELMDMLKTRKELNLPPGIGTCALSTKFNGIGISYSKPDNTIDFTISNLSPPIGLHMDSAIYNGIKRSKS